MMIGGYNEIDGAQLYVVEPSGTSFGYYGCAVGKGKQAARAEIEKMKTADMTCAELVKEAVSNRFPFPVSFIGFLFHFISVLTTRARPQLNTVNRLWLATSQAKIIYGVHDEIKDKHFSLFMSWVTADTGGKHELVPDDVFAEVGDCVDCALPFAVFVVVSYTSRGR
jgi:20S proteasome subunit alpha 7